MGEIIDQYANKFVWAGDNYHPENSHVVPALIRRFHDAKIKNLDNVIVWGSVSQRGIPLC